MDKRVAGCAVAIVVHRSFLSYTAVVASVVTRPNGNVAVDEVWVSFDAVTMVNTYRVRALMEGSVIFGMSLAFYRGITTKGGAIEQDNCRGGGGWERHRAVLRSIGGQRGGARWRWRARGCRQLRRQSRMKYSL